MREEYRLLLLDLEGHAKRLRLAESRARSATRKQRGDSDYADRCLTLAEAHAEAAKIYDRVAAEVSKNLEETTPASEVKK